MSEQTGARQRGDEFPRGKNVDVDALLDDERIVVDERPAWSHWAKQLLLAGLILVAALITQEPIVMAIAIIADVLILGWVWYQRRRVRYLITDRRILVVTGLTASATNEAWLEDVRGMQTGASFTERLLGHGHITVSESILPRKSSLPGVGLLVGFLPVSAVGSGLTLGGISNYNRIANLIRKRQSQRKS